MTTTTKELQGFTDRQEFDSSVIHEAFYDADTERLFLILHTGSTPAYSGVDAGSWTALKYNESAGRYWNKYIRHNPFFKGINGDVDLYRRSPEDDVEPVEVSEPSYDVEGVDLREAFAPSNSFAPSSSFSPVNVKTYLVTVEVQAGTLSAAVDYVSANGLSVIAVNPK